MPFSAGFSTHFDHLDGPRRAQGKMHRLGDILIIALCGVLVGAGRGKASARTPGTKLAGSKSAQVCSTATFHRATRFAA
jgi:hypothetical protein